MNSVPQYLPSEDRQEFQRLLDEVLRSAPHRPELATVGQRLSAGQLRAMALSATALITAAAAAEYRHYVEVREELRHPARSATSSAHGVAADDAGPDGTSAATAPDESTEATGAGAIAVMAVLAPVLAGTAAVIFLLVGYVLGALAPQRALARAMLTAGWAFGVLTAVAIVVAGTGLLLTALRNNGPAEHTGPDDASQELVRAREVWRDALLERGILPFLQDALARAGTDAPHRAAPPAPSGRMPRLGYGRPGFSSPDEGSAADRPSYSSPDYTSPDFGGPEHQPD